MILASRKQKILVVDDEEALVEGLATLLEDEGYEVHTAVTGDQMFEKIKTTKPDLILTDVMMPSFNGAEALAALAADSNTQHIRRVLMSASPEPQQDRKLWSEFIRKPFDIEEVTQKIAKCFADKI